MSENSVLHLQDLEFSWEGGPQWRVPNLRLERGECASLHAPSGSGKSTLLAILAGALLPKRGQVDILGRSLNRLSSRSRDRFRAENLGIIFHQFNLIPYLSPMDNVLLGLAFSKKRRQALNHSPRAVAETLLAHLGLPEWLWHTVTPRLDLEQQQRIAAARALIGAPALILADEASYMLDAASRDRFQENLVTQARQYGSSLLFVSHDPAPTMRFGTTYLIAERQEA